MKTKQDGIDRLVTVIEHKGDEKYVVLKVGDKEGERAVLVSLPLEYHSGIVREYQRRLNEDERILDVAGGGILEIDIKAKTIRTYGMSSSYGQPDPTLVERILKDDFPDYKLDVKVTSYIRG